jgi:hypothetical protein
MPKLKPFSLTLAWGDLDDERLCSDAGALYELIREARALAK